MRSPWVMLACVGVLAACGPDASSETTAPPPAASTTRPTFVASTTGTGTTAAPVPSAPPAFFRFDASGLYLVDADGERRIEADAVISLSHDGKGGAVYALDAETQRSGLQWWRADADEVETLLYANGWVAVLDGRPTLVTVAGTCPMADDASSVVLVDLDTRAERVVGCAGGEDGGRGFESGGGELLLAVFTYGPGASFTQRTLHFYALSGTEIDHPFNPFAESCAPCELGAVLSPDGGLLAYRFRPDAKWSPDPDERQRRDAMTYEEWWEITKDIDGEVTTLDLETGATLYTMIVPAGDYLTDFDGRFLVLEHCRAEPVDGHEPGMGCNSRIVDTKGVVAERVIDGRVRLATTAAGVSPP